MFPKDSCSSNVRLVSVCVRIIWSQGDPSRLYKGLGETVHLTLNEKTMCLLLAALGSCAARKEEGAVIRGSLESHWEMPTLFSLTPLYGAASLWTVYYHLGQDEGLASQCKSICCFLHWESLGAHTSTHEVNRSKQHTLWQSWFGYLVQAPVSLQPDNNVWTFTSSQPQLE